MKINRQIVERRKNTIDHLNRIQGQIEALKKYLLSDADCLDIALLTTSIARSFDTLRSKTMEGSIIHQVLNNSRLTPKQKNQIKQIIKLRNK